MMAELNRTFAQGLTAKTTRLARAEIRFLRGCLDYPSAEFARLLGSNLGHRLTPGTVGHQACDVQQPLGAEKDATMSQPTSTSSWVSMRRNTSYCAVRADPCLRVQRAHGPTPFSRMHRCKNRKARDMRICILPGETPTTSAISA